MTADILPILSAKSRKWIRDENDRMLWLHVPSGTWYVRAKRKGKKPLYKTTGHKTKGRAKTKALMMIAEWLGTRPTSDHRSGLLFSDFAASYLEHLEKTKLRPRTKEQARIYLGMLIKEMGHAALEDINEGYFDEWLADFRGRSKRTTFGDFAKYLGKAMRHAYKKRLVDRLYEFENPDPQKTTGRVYTRLEIESLLTIASQTLELQLRLSLQCFMRLREMLFLTWDRIDMDARRIVLGADDVKTGSQTGVGREFYFNEDIWHLLIVQRTKVANIRPASPFVFPSPSNPLKPIWSNKTAWRLAKTKVGIDDRARWHDLRHTALVWALLGDDEQQKLPLEQRMVANPLQVGQYAGVSVRTIERVYLKGKVRAEHTRAIAEWIKL